MNAVVLSNLVPASSTSTASPAAQRARIESLYRAHRASLVRFAAKRMPGRSHDAEDVVQDVFVDLLGSTAALPADDAKALERLRALVDQRAAQYAG